MTMKHKRYLKNYIIYPRFQYTLLITNAIINMAAFILIVTQVRSFFKGMINTGVQIGLPASHEYFQFINLQQQDLLPKLFGTALLSVLVTSVFSVWLSHRLSGPIVKLRNHLKRISDGEDVPDLKFRKNDFFMELPDLVNSAMKKRK